ncbi:MAG: 50S ribosomal protein L24 [Candidatus Woesearchaeota archaeon]|jgi:large subunit ribosomal protein L24|nr:50S ribosomal protein L24 [Candidatus Woesearchaeota archaeon]
MKTKFSTSWKASKQTRKQRKYRHNAPLHVKQKLVRAHLSKELIKKHGRRSLGLRKGDKVKVMRGEHKKYIGKVDKISLKKGKVYLEGIEVTKRDGTKTVYPFEPSNLMITELILEDKIRQKILERKSK